ncbi:MMPL family transporter [bacterium]|nr:MMPL family transporter [bacterium]
MNIAPWLLLILSLAGLPYISLHQDNELENWFGKGHAAVQDWDSARKSFFLDPPLVLHWEKIPTTYENFVQLASSLDRLCNRPEVQTCFTLKHAVLLSQGEESLDFLNPAEWPRILKELLDHPFYAKVFFPTQKGVLAYLHLREDAEESFQQDLLEECTLDGVFSLSSGTMLNREIQHISEEDSRLYFTFLPLLLGFFVWWLSRSWKLVLILFLVQGNVLILTLCIAKILGVSLTAVNMIVPPMLLSLTLASFFHLVFHANATIWLEEGIDYSLSHNWRVILMSKVTTATGFLTLSLSELETLRVTGYLCALGLALSYIALFTLFPFLVRIIRPESFLRTRWKNTSANLQKKLYRWVLKRHFYLAVGFIAILIPCLVLFFRTETSSHGIYMLPRGNELRRLMDNFEKSELLGTTRVELLIYGNGQDPGFVERVWSAQQEIEGLKGIRHCFSALDLASLVQWNLEEKYSPSLQGEQLAETYYSLRESPLGPLLNRYLQREILRVSIGLSIPTPQSWSVLEPGLRRILEQFQLEYQLTGYGVLETKMDRALLEVLQQSFLITLILLLMFLWYWTGSFFMGFIGLLPNMFPVLCIFAFMNQMSMPSNVATSLIAGITLGIAVDDTLHFLSDWRFQTGPPSIRFERFLNYSLFPITLTTLSMVLGYFVFLCASFVPIQTFGVFMLVGATMAWLGDCLFFPALLWVLERGEKSCVLGGKSF